MIRKFWWDSRKGERKVAWVSWEKMTQPKHMGGSGFRDIELFNMVMLAKQVWRLIQDYNSLSTQILRAVYYPNTNLLEAELGSSPSQIWRGNMEGRDTLKLGLIKRIGTGEDTKIWEQNWLPRDYKLRPVVAKTMDPPTMFADLIDLVNVVWNQNLLEEHFFQMDKDIILSIPFKF